MKEITRAAGARNESALHYHFGGLEPLIKEVFAKRYRLIEEARKARLAELTANGSANKVEAVLDAAVSPLMEACLETDGRLYARFCVQLVTDPRFDVAKIMDDISATSHETLRTLLLDCLGGIPADILKVRLRRVLVISMVLAADYARQTEGGSAPPVEKATREAVATLCGFLKARHAP